RCYPGEERTARTATLYEDDGISPAYRQGEFATTRITYQRRDDAQTIDVLPTAGKFQGQAETRSYVFEFPCTVAGAVASVGSKEFPTDFDERTATTRVRLTERSIREATTIRLKSRLEEPAKRLGLERARRAGLMMADQPTARNSEDDVAAML